jgi:hypothetical protein
MNALVPPHPPAKVEPYDVAVLRLLGRICEELDIPKGRFEQAEERYKTIGKLLNSEGNPLKQYAPQIYTQGSVRNRTAVKPPQGEEFDIDLVCELKTGTAKSPETIFNEVKAAILADKTYVTMVSEMNRCIRVTYANEFHLDITPAIPDGRFGPENICITDRPTKRWKEGNTKDYSEWLKAVAAVPPRVRMITSNSVEFGSLLEMRAGVEPVPQPTPDLPLLNRIIQVFKRHRDLAYLDDSTNQPISAIITTLTAHAYLEVCRTEHENLLDVIIAIAELMPKKLGTAVTTVAGMPIYTVLNPRNSLENYADKWPNKPIRQQEFFNWQRKLVVYLKGLQELRGRGKDALYRHLSTGLGEDVVKRSMIEKSQNLKEQAGKGLWGITSSGGLVAAVAARASAPAQTFHC